MRNGHPANGKATCNILFHGIKVLHPFTRNSACPSGPTHHEPTITVSIITSVFAIVYLALDHLLDRGFKAVPAFASAQPASF